MGARRGEGGATRSLRRSPGALRSLAERSRTGRGARGGAGRGHSTWRPERAGRCSLRAQTWPPGEEEAGVILRLQARAPLHLLGRLPGFSLPEIPSGCWPCSRPTRVRSWLWLYPPATIAHGAGEPVPAAVRSGSFEAGLAAPWTPYPPAGGPAC